jgi:hypothetical protein
MPHVLENEKPIILASSLSASPALAIEYVSAHSGGKLKNAVFYLLQTIHLFLLHEVVQFSDMLYTLKSILIILLEKSIFLFGSQNHR